MKLFGILLIGASIATAANAQDIDPNATTAHCATEWPNDFAMQKYCRDQIVEGFASYSAIKSNAAQDADFNMATLQKCEAEWIPQWQMVDYCAKQNITGRSELSATLDNLPSAVAATILTGCTAQWSDSYTMQAYCAGQQAKAWRDMQ